MRSVRIGLASLAFIVATAGVSWADVTAFLGATTTPTNRATTGAAVGTGLLAFGFEFEYSSAAEDAATGAPALKMGNANGLLQTPVPIHGIQPYITAGGGLYRERLGTSARFGLGQNVGGGLKMELAGPLRLRVDYRVFRLGDSAAFSPVHRIYAGLNLKF
jgi:hypothetical protein